MSESPWWTPREAARYWRLSERTVLRMIDRGEVPARRFGRQWRIHRRTIETFDAEPQPRQAEVGKALRGSRAASVQVRDCIGDL